MATTLATLIAQARVQLMELPALSTPTAPTITPQGTTGATTWTYKVVAINQDQTSIASSAGSTATGNATLTSTNNNQITWPAVTNAAAYQVYRTVAGTSPTTLGLIAVVIGLQFNDTGVAGDLSTAPSATTGGSNWTDAELLVHVTDAAKDMWAAILDVYGDHYFTVDTTHVTLAANGTSLSGVPTDCFRVQLIEPLDTTTSGNGASTIFVPRKYNHAQFVAARAQTAVDPDSAGVIFYDVSGSGSPIAAPTILVAPPVSTTMSLRFVYNPVLAAMTVASNNPIPGEADKALVAYCVAFARSKERDDRSPDPNWIAVYATEKQSILARITPRQEQEPEYVDGMFEETYY